MAVIVDTGPFLGLLNASDPWHARSVKLWKELRTGRHGRVLSTDLVLVEAMNFLARKPADVDLSSRLWREFERGAPVAWLTTGAEALKAAGKVHLELYARGLSMTDASLVVHARQLGAAVATLDGDFNGLVPIVTA